MASGPSNTSNTSNTSNIRLQVVRALTRAQRLAGGEIFATEQPIDPLRQTTTAVAAAAADLLDELLEGLVSDRQRLRSVVLDRMHATASSAAGDLRSILRTMRTLHPDQGSEYVTGCLRARDHVASIGFSAGTELAIEPSVP